jgi:hypothetical protein
LGFGDDILILVFGQCPALASEGEERKRREKKEERREKRDSIVCFYVLD